MNSISSLYEPFYQNTFVGNVVSTNDNPENGGVTICRAIKVKLRFQPGFDTQFSNTTSGTIYQTKFQQFNYDDLLDHSIGVKIPIINVNQILYTSPTSSLTPFSCTFEPYTSGTLYSTEILGSMNITVKELNGLQISDPNLYNSLIERYYYILKQRTNSGIETEKVFYKP